MTSPSAARVTFTDPATGERVVLVVPLPAVIGSAPGATISLPSSHVAASHARVSMETIGIVVESLGGPVFVDRQPTKRAYVPYGASVAVGPFHLTLSPAHPGEVPAPPPPSALGIPDAGVPTARPADAGPGAYRPPPTAVFALPVAPEPSAPAGTPGQAPPTGAPPPTEHNPLFQGPAAAAPARAWPPEAFASRVVSVAALAQTGLPASNVDYLTLGGGLGSFLFTATMLSAGAREAQIAALGTEPQPHARYRRLCTNSQIADGDRLRSNSDSTADNIWGFPGYGARELVREALRFHPLSAAKIGLQLLGEPTLTETYTPIARDVYESVDKECERIGWSRIVRYGRVRAVRMTDDGRYVVAYSSTPTGGHALYFARHLHLALGYPALQFLPDLRRYREETGDFRAVVNAYEQHEHVYEQLRAAGGLVLLRGRGIVSSRLLERIVEERRRNPNIRVVHLLRTPIPEGHRYGSARRKAENHFELQPFNWPKACFGGDLRMILADATPEQRKKLFADWGGTTTTPRRDWRDNVRDGLARGWYSQVFGEVEQVSRLPDGRVETRVQRSGGQADSITADFIVDATGLDAKVKESPLFADLVDTYGVPLNVAGRIDVTRDFEVLALRSGQGRCFAAGSATMGSAYAPVDSFLGLTYAARRAVDALAESRAPGVSRMGPLRSLAQWTRWMVGARP